MSEGIGVWGEFCRVANWGGMPGSIKWIARGEEGARTEVVTRHAATRTDGVTKAEQAVVGVGCDQAKVR
jgi:hypothetical protein